MNSQFSFDITFESTETNARLGIIHTPHGDIETPAFVPVGTQATVKSLTPEEIREVGTQLFFVNTYHMAMRPGIEIVKKLGGLHQFMHWDRPLITDSGGFQVFSLARRSFSEGGIAHENERTKKHTETDDPEPSHVKITDNGVTFRSHWDGSYHTFTPETSMEYQWELGSDIHIAFDDCTPYPVTRETARISMERTHRWAKRSLNAHQKLALDRHSRESGNLNEAQMEFPKDPRLRGDDGGYQALYGSIQGSIFKDLREESARFISGMDFDGIAIGGVSVGESKKEMADVLDWVLPLLPKEKPRHLLGVGEIDDVFVLIKHGIDTFDCVQPTRLARMGYVFSQEADNKKNKWEMDINKTKYERDISPIDTRCACYTCQHFSRAYIHHLFKVRELLGYRLATVHNVFFFHTLVNSVKRAIRENRLLELEQRFH